MLLAMWIIFVVLFCRS